LVARPGADLRHARAGGEIAVRLIRRDRLDTSAQPDLALQRLPIERQRRLRRCAQFPALHAVDVRVEDEAALVEALQQDHARIGQSVAIDGRQRHGVRIDRLRPFGLGEPGREQAQRLIGRGEVTGR
jgi:hypothetical protein